MKAKIALIEVAKILTATEGATTKDKVDEIFQIIFGISSVSSGLNDFFRKETSPIGDILKEWVQAEGLVDVIDINHMKTNWCFCVRAARIPKEFYESTGAESATRLAGEAIGVTLGKKVHLMYGDSRLYKGPCNTGNKFINVAFIFGYKENTGRWS